MFTSNLFSPVYARSALCVAFALTLSACGDNTDFTQSPGGEPTAPTDLPLYAFPLSGAMLVGETKSVDVTPAVLGQADDAWTLNSAANTSASDALGTVSNLASPTFNYHASAPGVAVVNYHVSDSDEQASSQALIAINNTDQGGNTAPTAADVFLSTDSDTAISGSLDGKLHDADGDEVTVVQQSGGIGGLVFSGNSFQYSPNGFIGVDQITYGVTDGNGAYALGTIYINVSDANSSAANTAPTAADYAFNTDDESPVDIDLSALGLVADADGDTVILQRVAGSERASRVNDTVLRYTPNGFVGAERFVYLVTDNKNGYALAEISVTVSDANPPTPNTAPVATDVVADTISSGASTQIDLSGYVSDVDGDALTLYSVLGAQGHANISTTQPLVIDYVASGVSGMDKFVYTVTDGKGGFAQAQVQINVQGEPVVPPFIRVLDIEGEYAAGSTLTANVVCDACVPSRYEYQWRVGDTSSAVVSTTSKYEMTTADMGKDILLTVVGYSDTNLSTTASETLHPVTGPGVPLDKDIVAFASAEHVTVGDSVTVDVTNNVMAVNAWQLTSVVGSAGLGQVTNVTSPQFTFRADSVGVETVTFQVSDGNETATAAVVIAINANQNNQAPTANDVSKVTDSETPISIDLTTQVADAEGDTVSVVDIKGGAGQFTYNGFTVNYDPQGFVGVDQAVYSVTDGYSYTLGTITVSVADANPEAPNTAPEAQNYQRNTDSDTGFVIDINALNLVSDADGDAVTLLRVASSSRASVDGQMIRYEPAGFVGVDQFVYVVTDGNGGYALGEVTVTVSDAHPEAPNHAPTAQPITASVMPNNALQIALGSYVADEDGDALSIVSVLGAHGQATIDSVNALTINYTPTSVGEDDFVYTVTDGRGGYAQNVVTVTVTDTNPTAPVAQDKSIMVTTLSDYIDIDVASLVSDADGDAVSLSRIGTPTAPATAAILNDTTIRYTFNGNIQIDQLTYTVTDGRHEATGTLFIYPNLDNGITINDAIINLTALAPGQSHTENISVADLVSQDLAEAGLFLISVSGGNLGSVTNLNPNAMTFDYVQHDGVYGDDNLSYVVYSSVGNSAFATVRVHIAPPDVPSITALSVDKSGVTLTPTISCDTCVRYEYTWVLNGLTVSTAPTYDQQEADLYENIRLEVTGYDAFEQHDKANVVYAMNYTEQFFESNSGTLALMHDGSVVAWGDPTITGLDIVSETAAVQDELFDVQKIVASDKAYAALRADGKLVIWGSASQGGGERRENIKDVIMTRGEFTALSADGTVEDINTQLTSRVPVGVFGNVQAMYDYHTTHPQFGNYYNYVVINQDGTVGAMMYDYTHINNYIGQISSIVSSITDAKKAVVSPYGAAVLKRDGRVSTWGLGIYQAPVQAMVGALSGIEQIFTAGSTFAALDGAGNLYWWGSRTGSSTDTFEMSSQPITDVVDVQGSEKGLFIALRADGTVVQFGFSNDLSYESIRLDMVESQLVNVKKLYANGNNAFAALLDSGKVVTWGLMNAGGKSSMVSQELASGVVSIFPYTYNGSVLGGFVALKEDGSTVVWGGSGKATDYAPDELTDVKSITAGSFFCLMAQRQDKSVLVWDNADNNGTQCDISAVDEKLQPHLAIIESSLP